MVTGRVVVTGRVTTGRVIAGVGIVWFGGVAPLAVACPAGVLATCVAHQYRSRLNPVPGPPVCCAPVHGVLVVETPARRVQLDKQIAHVDRLTQGVKSVAGSRPGW